MWDNPRLFLAFIETKESEGRLDADQANALRKKVADVFEGTYVTDQKAQLIFSFHPGFFTLFKAYTEKQVAEAVILE